MKDWDLFLWPYQQAVSELKVKFRSLRQSFLNKGEHSPIEFVVGRVKTVDSIKEKMTRRVIAPEVIVSAGSIYRGNGNEFLRINLASPKSMVEDRISRLIIGIKKYSKK